MRITELGLSQYFSPSNKSLSLRSTSMFKLSKDQVYMTFCSIYLLIAARFRAMNPEMKENIEHRNNRFWFLC